MKSEEFPQRAQRYRRERLKFKDLAGVEAMRGGSSFIYERQQRSDRLVDTVPLLRSLIIRFRYLFDGSITGKIAIRTLRGAKRNPRVDRRDWPRAFPGASGPIRPNYPESIRRRQAWARPACIGPNLVRNMNCPFAG